MVTARTSVSQYKGAAKSIRQVGSELGVGAVLEGSVRRAGDRLRITLQLIDADSEEHRWAETFDRQLSDVFEIQAEVAGQTAAALKIQLLESDREAVRRPPIKGVEAFELYLRGVVGFQLAADGGFTKESLEEPVRCFESAISKDPSSAAARAWLANLYTAAMGENISKASVAPKVRELVATAYRLDPREAEVRTARGNYALQFELDWALAEREFRAAIEESPSAMSAHAWLGVLLVTLGRFREAADELQTAMDLNPMFLNLVNWRIRALDLGGDHAGALALTERYLERYPGSRQLRIQLGQLYLRAGRAADAKEQLRLSAGPPGGAPILVARAELDALLGDPSEARSLTQDWERGSVPMFMRPLYVAGLYTALGENEKALELLEQDFREGEQSLWIDFRRHSFDPIRQTPRFLALLKQMNLPP